MPETKLFIILSVNRKTTGASSMTIGGYVLILKQEGVLHPSAKSQGVT